MVEPTNEDNVFKVPSLLINISKPPSEVSSTINVEKVDTITDSDENEEKETSGQVNTSNEHSNVDKGSKLNIPTQVIPYQEPSWGGLPNAEYSLEEIKNGSVVQRIPLDKRSFHLFGRLENCHVVMAHPTVSRYHAVLQFRSTFSNDDEKKGFYLYDLGSTHGTFVNRYRILPKSYVKVQVGHTIKFGSSTRFFLLQGPEEDQEDESEYTYTEMKEMRKTKLEERKLEKEKREAAEEERGIDWGMGGEDADAESDLKENPFAMTTNEEMYKDDPKKVLRCWFEREGQELNYKIDEKGYGHFRCIVELPIETASGGMMTAEAVVSGRKKEASFQCALEACRMLDRAGLLKQNNQETRKRKLKNWEEDDYYDSDEDNFFDRTGELEIKRRQRMKQVKKSEPVVDTYETLLVKHSKLVEEITLIEKKMNSMLKEAGCDGESEQQLESYDERTQRGQKIDKLEMKKLKINHTTLKNEEQRLQKLINFVKPYDLPKIENPPKVIKKEKLSNAPIEEHQFDSVTEATENVRKELITNVITENVKTESYKEEIFNDINVQTETTEKFEEEICEEEHLAPKTKKSSRARANKNKKSAESFNNEYEEDFNNIVWVPPSNQTGDGRTSLNDKLGY